MFVHFHGDRIVLIMHGYWTICGMPDSLVEKWG